MIAPTLAPPDADSKPLLTAEDLLALQGRGRFELVKGKVIEMSPPGFEHGTIAMTLGELIASHVRRNKLGRVLAAETGFRLSRNPDTVRAPDVAFVSNERLPAKLPKGYADFAPDLIAEVVSPGDDPDDIQTKITEWLNAGVRLALVVYPSSRQIAVYRSLRDVIILTDSDTLTADNILPGLSIPLASIFS
ncbi:MAG: Uma2 family endonuclease [Chloroflexi bacterium]|nr:Uma2 family endonuclease [Chloroflexota bacterium]